MYSQQDCIKALKDAAERLGHSPTVREYQELDISPSVGTIKDTVGSWDEAKELCGLEKCTSEKEFDKPNCLNISDEEWDLYKTRRKRILKRRVLVAKRKVSKGCKRCGYDKRAVALDYHHTGNEKSMSVAERITRCHSKEKILKEIENCEILCANCHRIETDSTIDLSGCSP